MSKIRLAMIGCGGMGHRHLYGLMELDRAGWQAFELVAACDPVQDNAISLAEQAAEYFGVRPMVVSDLADLDALEVSAVDVTTTPPFHHTVAIAALERGWHVMIEKPLALTVLACNHIRRAVENSGCVLSVAENYRRDPINRLARALLDAGVIGTPRFMVHHVMDGSDKMLISVWRHQKDQSGVLLDVGVHYTDMMEFLLGDIVTVYAQTRLHEPTRRNPAPAGGETGLNPGGFYDRWQKTMPAEFTATAEDAAYATFTFASGAVAQYIEDHAAHGLHGWMRRIYGSKGALDLPQDRSGKPIRLDVVGQEQIAGERLLDLVPAFRLDRVTAALFGGERLWRYDFPFTETDRKIIAIEYAEFADAMRGERTIEVDAWRGTRAVAGCYAMLESGMIGRAVTLDEVLTEQLDAYQREINQSLGI